MGLWRVYFLRVCVKSWGWGGFISSVCLSQILLVNPPLQSNGGVWAGLFYDRNYDNPVGAGSPVFLIHIQDIDKPALPYSWDCGGFILRVRSSNGGVGAGLFHLFVCLKYCW